MTDGYYSAIIPDKGRDGISSSSLHKTTSLHALKYYGLITGNSNQNPWWCHHVTYKLLHLFLTATVNIEETLIFRIITTTSLTNEKLLEISSYSSLIIILSTFHLGLNISEVLQQQKELGVNNYFIQTTEVPGPAEAQKCCLREMFVPILICPFRCTINNRGWNVQRKLMTFNSESVQKLHILLFQTQHVFQPK